MAITEQQMRSIAGALVNKYVDVDGAAGNQCWDSATYINEVFFGLPRINTFGAGRWPGWAGNMVDAFPQSAAVAAAYELVPPDRLALPGDTLVWGDSNREWYPKTHVATCIVDPGNGWPLCLSQNSSMARPDLPGYSEGSTGPVIVQSLPKAGLIGIIRPRTGGAINTQSTTTQPSQEDDMPSIDEIRKVVREEVAQTPKAWFKNKYGTDVQFESLLGAIDLNINGNNANTQAKLDRIIGEVVGLRAAVSALAKGSNVTPEQVDKSIKEALSGFSITLTADGGKSNG